MFKHCKIKNPYTPSNGQADNQVNPRKQHPSIHNCYLGRQTPGPWMPLLPPPELLLMSTLSYDMQYSFGQFRSAVLAVPPPNFLYVTSLLTEDSEWEKEKASMCKDRSAMERALVCCNSDLLTNPKHSTIWAAMKNPTSSQPDPLCLPLQ